MASKDTQTDKLTKRFQNYKIVAFLIVGGSAVAGVLLFYGVVDDFRKRIFPPTDQIFAQCQFGPEPSVMPPEGRMYVLHPQEAMDVAGHLVEYFGPPGAERKPQSDKRPPLWGYRCELTNYAREVLFNVDIPLRLTFLTPVPVQDQPNALREGAITLVRDWAVTVPKLDPAPAAPYVFYIWNNLVPKFVQVRLPEFASTGNKQIPIVQSQGNLHQPLLPYAEK